MSMLMNKMTAALEDLLDYKGRSAEQTFGMRIAIGSIGVAVYEGLSMVASSIYDLAGAVRAVAEKLEDIAQSDALGSDALSRKEE